jgi:hypothetical protein
MSARDGKSILRHTLDIVTDGYIAVSSCRAMIGEAETRPVRITDRRVSREGW